MEQKYVLPGIDYGYKELEPYMSEMQLTLHHQKHHQAYVNAANAIIERLQKARKENSDIDMKSTLKELSFNIAGHLLHSLFWENLSPASKSGMPDDELNKAITDEFGSFERFKKEFSQAALSVEGSGWAALSYCPLTKRLVIMQIEKHNANVCPTYPIILVIDVFEHAYYVDYKNERANFIDAFCNIINWDEASKRFKSAIKQ